MKLAPDYEESYQTWGVYLQDEWRLKPSAAFELGAAVRSDALAAFQRRNGKRAGLSQRRLAHRRRTTSASVQYGGEGAVYPRRRRFGVSADYRPGVRHPICDNFGPRIGLA